MPSTSPTTATRLTPQGRGAVASIVVQGRLEAVDEFFHAINSLPVSEQKMNRICYGLWGTDHQEDVVGIKLDEETFEIHCHGGSVAVGRILNDLKSTGVCIQNASEFQTAEITLQDEFALCIQRATTQRTAHFLLRQSQLFPKAFDEFRKLNEEDISHSIQKMLDWSEFGKHLVQPWQVVLCGSPNVGKSSLINALVGYSRSVVFDQPGTTRDVVSVQTALQGWPIEFSDTAGLRETAESLEALGIEKAKAKIQDADLLLIVVDAREEISEFEKSILESNSKTILVVNKIDLALTHRPPENCIEVSATEALGINELAERIVELLIPDIPSETQAFPVTQRQVEMLRVLYIDKDE